MIDRAQAWQDLAAAEPVPLPHSDAGLNHLPAPAKRFLDHALPAQRLTVGAVVLEMEGEIKLKRWMPFRARQILHPNRGFVWNATVGHPPVRFKGGDAYWHDNGALEFRLWGLIPVARAAGHDIDRSAAGRLAAETAAWAPQALHPAAGAVWRAIDDDRAAVTRTVSGEPIEVTLTIDPIGRPQELIMQRWGDPDSDQFNLHSFGASITETGIFDGVTLATAGTVGWYWGTDRQPDGEFFRYHITHAQPAPSPRHSS